MSPTLNTSSLTSKFKTQPLMIEVSDRETGLQGWLCVDSPDQRLCFGGTRIWPTVSPLMVRGLARVMSLKLAVHGSAVGGAKAGICADPADPRLPDFLRTFGATVAGELRGRTVLGKDMGAQDAHIELIYQGAGCAQMTPAMGDAATGKWLRDLPGYRAQMTALGVLWSIQHILKDRLEEARVVVQGLGVVGAGAVRRLADEGARVVAVCDAQLGCLARNGLPVDALLEAIKERPLNKSSIEGALTWTDPDAVLAVEADVLVLAAGSYFLTQELANQVGARWVVEAANMGITTEGRRTLLERDIQIVPDMVAGSTSAALVALQLEAAGKGDPEQIWTRIQAGIQKGIDRATGSDAQDSFLSDPSQGRASTEDAAPASPQSWFHRVATDYVVAQAFYHLGETGVFQVMCRGPVSASKLADELGLDESLLQKLLEYLCATDPVIGRDLDNQYYMTKFGQAVVKRFGREEEDGTLKLNLFGVRVGAYGPVWSRIGAMLRNEVVYGEDFHRYGAAAAEALFRFARNFLPCIEHAVATTRPDTIVEFGVTTGLLQDLGRTSPQATLVGIDRSPDALADAAAHVDRSDVRWLEADLQHPEGWVGSLSGRGLLYSVHFHEFLAMGDEVVVPALRHFFKHLPEWSILAIEQPALPLSQREGVPEAQWLNAQSNILIHEFIENAKILSDAGWKEFFGRCGHIVECKATGFLGYKGYLIQARPQ